MFSIFGSMGLVVALCEIARYFMVFGLKKILNIKILTNNN